MEKNIKNKVFNFSLNTLFLWSPLHHTRIWKKVMPNYTHIMNFLWKLVGGRHRSFLAFPQHRPVETWYNISKIGTISGIDCSLWISKNVGQNKHYSTILCVSQNILQRQVRKNSTAPRGISVYPKFLILSTTLSN